MDSRTRALMLVSIALLSKQVANAAPAVDSTSGSDSTNTNALEEVVVTAEKKSETASHTPVALELIRQRDWRGLIHYGAIFFVLEKLAAVTGVSNLHVYAAMRGQTLEEFQATRNAAIQYGVSR